MIKLSNKKIIRDFVVEFPLCIFDSYSCDPNGIFTMASRTVEKHWNDSFIASSSGIHGSGEDPRMFIYKGSPALYSVSHRGGFNFQNRIYLFSQNKWVNLIPPKGIEPGKNWSPFILDGKIFFIHEFSPFRILEATSLSPSDSHWFMETIKESDFYSEKTIYDGYPTFRGGSNGLEVDGGVIGFGHTNHGISTEKLTHRPFCWFLSKSDLSLQLITIEAKFDDLYEVIDPTSFIFHQGKYFLFTCETEKGWFQMGQRGRICCYQVSWHANV